MITKNSASKMRRQLWTQTSILMTLMLSWTSVLTGCVHPKVIVLPADRSVTRMPAGKPYTPEIPGYFVPDARMLDILNRLSAKDAFGPKGTP